MIETLGNPGTLSNLRSATLAPAREEAGYDLEITGITFKGGDLCRALYPTIFDYVRAPWDTRFEPGVQILQAGKVLRFLFRIDGKQGVEILTDDAGVPVVESVTDPYAPVAGLTAALLDPRTCELTWDQEEANKAHGGFVKVTALRIVCRLLDRDPTDPELVDGGLYLAIVNRPEEAGPDLGIGDPGKPEPYTIKMLGSDVFGRPVYDLFLPEAQALLPPCLGLEPTICLREDDVKDIAIQIATKTGIDLRFERAPANPGEVRVHGYEPRGWPAQLRSAEREEEGKRAQLLWIQETGRHGCTIGSPEQEKNYCLVGQITTFYLEADLKDGFSLLDVGGDELEMWRRRGIRMQLDPTVIQPPSCTASGICI
ncbi:MAG: hypothetical protein ABUT39_09765 [Acidobacteriota bacterium]